MDKKDKKDKIDIGELIGVGLEAFKNSMNDKDDDDDNEAAKEARKQGIINAACALNEAKVTNAKAASLLSKYWNITPSSAKTYVENAQNIYMPMAALKEYLMKYQDMSSAKANNFMEKNRVESYLRKHKSAKRLTPKELYSKILAENE